MFSGVAKDHTGGARGGVIAATGNSFVNITAVSFVKYCLIFSF